MTNLIYTSNIQAAAVLGGSKWCPNDVSNSASTAAQIKKELKALFKKADADNSGEIEYSEFKQVHFTVTYIALTAID
jgi:EF hand